MWLGSMAMPKAGALIFSMARSEASARASASGRFEVAREKLPDADVAAWLTRQP